MRTHFIFAASFIIGLLFTGYSAAANPTPNQDQSDQTSTSLPPDLIGTWKVERLWADTTGVSAYALDDATAIGSMMTISPETIHWSYPVSVRFIETNVCKGPALTIIHDADKAKAISAPFIPAIPYFGITAEKLTVPYEMTCSESGHWGPEMPNGNNFYIIDGNRMMMRWYDGAILLLKHQQETKSSE